MIVFGRVRCIVQQKTTDSNKQADAEVVYSRFVSSLLSEKCPGLQISGFDNLEHFLDSKDKST